jgi:hypothetical protein
MFNSKTHFEQVPLEIIKEIVEKQTLMEAANEPDQQNAEEKLSDVFLEVEKRSTTQPHTSAQVESSN